MHQERFRARRSLTMLRYVALWLPNKYLGKPILRHFEPEAPQDPVPLTRQVRRAREREAVKIEKMRGRRMTKVRK